MLLAFKNILGTFICYSYFIKKCLNLGILFCICLEEYNIKIIRFKVFYVVRFLFIVLLSDIKIFWFWTFVLVITPNVSIKLFKHKEKSKALSSECLYSQNLAYTANILLFTFSYIISCILLCIHKTILIFVASQCKFNTSVCVSPKHFNINLINHFDISLCFLSKSLKCMGLKLAHEITF